MEITCQVSNKRSNLIFQATALSMISVGKVQGSETLFLPQYSQTCVKRSLKRQHIYHKINFRLMQVKSIAECSGEYSAILSTFIQQVSTTLKQAETRKNTESEMPSQRLKIFDKCAKFSDDEEGFEFFSVFVLCIMLGPSILLNAFRI